MGTKCAGSLWGDVRGLQVTGLHWMGFLSTAETSGLWAFGNVQDSDWGSDIVKTSSLGMTVCLDTGTHG